jgi:hypothetical protein
MNHHPPQQSNGLGIAAFICSLLGVISCGALSPLSLVGFILALFAIRREPRGFAIAGLVLGIIGSLGIILLIVGVGFAAFIALIGGILTVFGVGGGLQIVGAELEADANAQAVVDHIQRTGNPPVLLDDVAGIGEDEATDPWGNRYELVLAPNSATVISAGPDGQFDTDDDISAERDLTRPIDVNGGDDTTDDPGRSDDEPDADRPTLPPPAPAQPSGS